MEEQNTTEKPDKRKKPNLKILGLVLAIVGIILIVYILLAGFGYLSGTRDDDVSLSQIRSEVGDNPIVLYFWSNGCSYCVQQKPIISDLEEDYRNVTFYWLDVNNHDNIADEYDVYGVPTTVILDNNGVVKKFVGLTDQNKLENAIEDAIDSY
jgi:thioredoxin 1